MTLLTRMGFGEGYTATLSNGDHLTVWPDASADQGRHHGASNEPTTRVPEQPGRDQALGVGERDSRRLVRMPSRSERGRPRHRGWGGDVPVGHSHCDIMALASVVNAECFLAVSALVDCMVAGGVAHDEAWSEIKRGSAEYLARRRVDG